ncbi:MAG: hypothetical protein ACT6UH_00175 [Hydrogenophaga sp.]|uniref:hypothetical protein n=1 Tax=Hydrogenophaga sp. TaxID=1904254 RepID=UPI0040360EE2
MKQGRKLAKGLGVSALIGTLALAGCGGDKRAEGGDAARTPQQVIEQLEASGELPKLERLPSVEGMDANGNGVRDDIETHIHRKYTDPAQRKAAMQMARALQRALLVDKSDSVAIDAAAQAIAKAVDCSFDIFAGADNEKHRYRMSNELESITTNTKERLNAYLAFNKAVSGSVTSSYESRGCD